MKPLLVNAVVAVAVAAVCSSSPASAFCGIRLSPARFDSFKVQLYTGSASGGEVGDVTPSPTVNDDDLTKEELGAILRDIRAHTRSQFEDVTSIGAIKAQADLLDRLNRMRLPNLRLRRCEVRPSAIQGAGLGLFATRPIRQDELITVYPGDALLLWDASHGGKPGPEGCDLRSIFGNHITASEQTSLDFFLRRTNARDYEVQTSAMRSIVGDPHRSEDAAYIGHFANDGAALLGGDDAQRLSYSLTSAKAMNACFVSLERCHLVTMATRDIKMDEEVLMSYGEGYWLTRAGPVVTKQAADADASRGGKSPTDLRNEVALRSNSMRQPSKKKTRSSSRRMSLKDGSKKKISRGFG